MQKNLHDDSHPHNWHENGGHQHQIRQLIQISEAACKQREKKEKREMSTNHSLRFRETYS